MNIGIRQIHWDVLPAEKIFNDKGPCRVAIAIWPAPVNADACFEHDGFHDFFAGSNEEWDAWQRDWREFVRRVVRQMESFGRISIPAGADVWEPARTPVIKWLLSRFLPIKPPMKKVPLSLEEQIAAATTYGEWCDVWIKFGDIPAAYLRAGHGHELLWIGWNSADLSPEMFVFSVAGDVPAIRTTLKWSSLLPKA